MLADALRWAHGFTFTYPVVMSWVWITGALFYYLHYERRDRHLLDCVPLVSGRGISIVIPCYNEADNVRETIRYACSQDYPGYEVIAVNDGSADDTGALLDALVREWPALRVVHLERNQGKAVALNTAARLARHDVLVCIDGDAILDPRACAWLVRHFDDGPRVGAVTGNPRVRNRSTLLGRLQVGEFSSIIGMIKRAQRTYGRLFACSGVITAFRRTALEDVGYWSDDMITEDVDITWKLQIAHWDVRFEPNARAWILMPETLRGLWRQRLRWARGGCEVLLRYAGTLRHWRKRRLWAVFLEYCTSVLWAYLMAGLIMLWGLGLVLGLPDPLRVHTLLPGWTGLVIGATCLVQVAVGKWLDSPMDVRLARNFFWMIWYPLGYWVISMLTTVAAVPLALAGAGRGRRARWTSPDRGLR